MPSSLIEAGFKSSVRQNQNTQPTKTASLSLTLEASRYLARVAIIIPEAELNFDVNLIISATIVSTSACPPAVYLKSRIRPEYVWLAIKTSRYCHSDLNRSRLLRITWKFLLYNVFRCCVLSVCKILLENGRNGIDNLVR